MHFTGVVDYLAVHFHPGMRLKKGRGLARTQTNLRRDVLAAQEPPQNEGPFEASSTMQAFARGRIDHSRNAFVTHC